MSDDLGWDEFMRVDMRVGRIVEVEDFPEARRPAWKLRVDFGEQIGVRRSSAQITNYERDELVGRRVIARRELPAQADRARALGVPGPRHLHGRRHGAAARARARGGAGRPRRARPPTSATASGRPAAAARGPRGRRVAGGRRLVGGRRRRRGAVVPVSPGGAVDRRRGRRRGGVHRIGGRRRERAAGDGAACWSGPPEVTTPGASAREGRGRRALLGRRRAAPP